MKSIKINGKKYSVSFIDTEDTVRNMVALQERTFTNYVKFSKFDLPNNVTINLLPTFLKDVDEEELEPVTEQLSKDWDVPRGEIALEWLGMHNKGKFGQFELDLLQIFQNINSIDFWSKNAIETAYGVYETKKKTALEKLKKIVDEENIFRGEYNKYEPLETTKFLQDSVIIEYEITINLDPLEAFDSIKLNNTIPYVRLKTADQTYYKLLKTLIPDKSWLEGDSTLVFKIYRPGEKDEWGTATINYKSIEEPYTAIMTIESSVGTGKGKTKTSEELLKNTILGVFSGTDIQIKSREEKGVKGVFAVPEMNISRDVFLDLITNEPMVSHYLYVDETRELSSQKGVLYLYYSPGESETQILTVFLSERTVSRSDIFYENKELLLFTPYLNVRVSRAISLGQIDRFKQAFAVILDIYKKKFNSIAKLYDNIIPGFKATNELLVKKSVQTDKRLKDLQTQDAELFIHGYPTSCEKKRQPIPIDQKSQKSWEKQGRQVMNYPKGSTNFYICSDENKFQYPGLMNNKLNNSQMYPYLPCCYPVNQKTGKKLLNVYLKDLTKTSHSKTTNIVAKKAVGRGKLGMLPRNIYYILNKNVKKGENFFRQGVEFSNNSFIEAVLLALDPDYEKIPDTDKGAYVADFRNNLASQSMSTVIQELYDIESEKIIKDILNPEIIFDSKIFIGLLEAYYSCQIVVFERSKSQPNGEFEIPRYTQGYLFRKLNPNIKTVLIYKHLGSRSDNLVNPHYELIIKKYNNIITWYLENDLMIRNVYKYFLQTYKVYLIGIGRYAAINVPPAALEDAIGQVVDRYGKTRGYIFKNNIFIATSPLPPAYDLDIIEIPTDRPVWENVLEFIQERGLTIIQQDVFDNVTVGVTIDFPGIPYTYIPFEPTKILSGISQGKHLGFSIPTREDILQNTLDNRKIADFLMQLVLYSFSLWYEDQIESDEYKDDVEELNKMPIAIKQVEEKNLLLNLVEKFFQEKVIIIPEHDYDLENLPRRLSINNSFFQNDQLVANSQKTFERLNYYLRFMVGKNKSLVTRYSERIHLENYYTYADDFQHQTGQLVFIGGLSISNWIETREHGVSNQVHTIPHAYLDEPFFYSHWALNGGKPVIFQNVQYGTLGRALAVSAQYIKTGVNVGYNPTPIKELDHTVYFIQDGVLKRDGDSPIKVWRFAENFYAALLIP